jgi:(p)ppGpp synthase/HD superfamily hydrolase
MARRGRQLTKMLGLVNESFAGRVDRGGSPYILHLLRVMLALQTTDEELQCIALGHDLFEDTDISRERLRQMGFSERVIAGISDMSREDGEPEDAYRRKVKSNLDSVKVKKVDLKDNMDLSRLKRVTDKDLTRNASYEEFYRELEAEPMGV